MNERTKLEPKSLSLPLKYITTESTNIISVPTNLVSTVQSATNWLASYGNPELYKYGARKIAKDTGSLIRLNAPIPSSLTSSINCCLTYGVNENAIERTN